METSSRRKACDTCYNKKIKCDMAKPVCSNCELYKVKCTTSVVRRRAILQKDKTVNLPPHTTELGQESLEARLARIESKLDSLGVSGSVTLANLLDSQSSSNESSPDNLVASQCSLNNLSVASSNAQDSLSLPPLQEILPVIESYLKDFNSVIPLFHQTSLMKMLNDAYSRSTPIPKTVWAVINIVLAIGHLIRSINADPVRSRLSEICCQECVANVNKVLHDLMTRDEDTLGAQVILGLIIVYQASANLRPTSILISTAVRLAHRLQLHTRASHASFTPDEANQRDKIFWICYFLDKDISTRTKTPPVQRDIDIDLDLPGTSQSGDDGELRTLDGLSRFNYFRARVQLAHLEGKIFDNLYSVRSRKLCPDERQQRVVALDTMIDEWQRTIPTSFQLEYMTQSLSKVATVHMTTLQHHYLLCLVMVHGLYSVDSGWVKAMGDFGRVSLENFDNNTDTCMHHMQPPLPSAWAKCVTASRGSIRLFLAEPQNSCAICLNMGVFFSGLIILLANAQYYPTNEMITQDYELAQDGIKLLTHINQTKQEEQFHTIIHILHGLDAIAYRSIQYYETHPNESPSVPINVQGVYPHIPLVLFDTVAGDASDGNSQLLGAISSWPNDLTFDPYDLDITGFDSFHKRSDALFADGSLKY